MAVSRPAMTVRWSLVRQWRPTLQRGPVPGLLAWGAPFMDSSPETRTAADAAIRMCPAGLAVQLRMVAAARAAQLAGMAVFIVVAPRLMGPERFGELAVILSISGLWATASTLGGRYAFGRFMPGYVVRGAPTMARALFMHVLQFRLAVVVAAAPALFIFLRHLLPDASVMTLLASVAAFVLAAAASPMFNVLFGLNRLGASMTGQALDRALLLLMLVTLGGAASLERASLALLATNLLLLGVGVVLARDMFTLDRAAFHLPSALEHLRFGVAVFAANFLLRVPWRLGESALALGGVDSSEIAFFSIALSATVAFTGIVAGTATLLIPSVGVHQAAGDTGGRDHSLGLGLRYLTIGSVLFVLAALACGPWAVRTFLGDAYAGVIPNLLVVVWAALAMPFIRTALSLEVVRNRVDRNLLLGLVVLAVFGSSALVLVPRYASLGASSALVLAIGITGLVAVLQMRATGVLAAARTWRHMLAAAGPAALLLVIGGSPPVAVAAAVVYVGGLFGLGVVSWDELRHQLAGSSSKVS